MRGQEVGGYQATNICITLNLRLRCKYDRWSMSRLDLVRVVPFYRTKGGWTNHTTVNACQ
eukprot:13043537-Ditylum_brightwellii.AAC.1